MPPITQSPNYLITKRKPVVGVVMDSAADAPTMEQAGTMLKQFHVPYEMHVMALRGPTGRRRGSYVRAAASRGIKVLIAGATSTPRFATVCATQTILPVIGVPMMTARRAPLANLLSSFPRSTEAPVATVATQNATNAALLAVQCLALTDRRLERALTSYKRQLAIQNRSLDSSLDKLRTRSGFRPTTPKRSGAPQADARLLHRSTTPSR